MASSRQVYNFIAQNDSSKNKRVFRQMQDELADLPPCGNETAEAADEREMKVMRPYYKACLQRNFHEFKMVLHGFKCICATNAPVGEIAGGVLFFHGLGASPHAFLRVFDNFYAHYGASVPMMFVLPQAPLAMHPEELGADASCAFGSYKWWDIIDPGWTSTKWFARKIKNDAGVVERAEYPQVDQEKSSPDQSHGNKRRKCASDVPSGLTQLRPLIEGLRQEICKSFRIPYTHLALGGFSQGAMLSADTFFQSTEPPLAVGIFSGAPMCLKQWAKTVKSWESQDQLEPFQGVPILQTHGTNDTVLLLKAGRVLRKALRTHGLHHRMATFPGDHFLPDTVINLFGSVVICRLRHLYQRHLQASSLGMLLRDGEEFPAQVQSESRQYDKYLGPSPEIVELLKLEEDVDFLGYFEKQPIRHFYGGSQYATPPMKLESSAQRDKLRVRRQRRRKRLVAEFGFAESDEKLCETSDSLAESENDGSKSTQHPRMSRWTCITRNEHGESGEIEVDQDEDIDDIIRINKEKTMMRKKLRQQKKTQDKDDGRLTFGSRSGYKLSYGFLRCCLPVASHCIE